MWDAGVSGRRGVRRREMAWRRGVEWRRERVGKEGCAEMICAKLQPVIVWALEERWPWASIGGLVYRFLWGWGVTCGCDIKTYLIKDLATPPELPAPYQMYQS